MKSKTTTTAPLRRSLRKKKFSQFKWLSNYKYVARQSTTMSDLPNEILVKCFSLLPENMVRFKVSAVCKHWNELAKCAIFWKTLNLNGSIPTKVASKWISISTQLKHLVIKGRTDLTKILYDVSENCQQLETLEIFNCTGSPNNLVVHSWPMCNIITKCCKLRNIHLHGTAFRSGKFFKLLAENKIARRAKACVYRGPVSSNQLLTFLVSIAQYELEKGAKLGSNEGELLTPVELKNYYAHLHVTDNMAQDIFNYLQGTQMTVC